MCKVIQGRLPLLMAAMTSHQLTATNSAGTGTLGPHTTPSAAALSRGGSRAEAQCAGQLTAVGQLTAQTAGFFQPSTTWWAVGTPSLQSLSSLDCMAAFLK
jgi:hypothetical protein